MPSILVDNKNGTTSAIPNAGTAESPALAIQNSKRSSSYTGDITFTTAGVAVALATGTTSISLTNIDGVNFGRFAFGESEAEAIANAATGKRLFPMAAGSESRAHLDMGVSKNATHVAGIADTASILVDVQQEK